MKLNRTVLKGVQFSSKDMPWFTWLILSIGALFVSIGIACSFYYGYSTITYKKASVTRQTVPIAEPAVKINNKEK